MPLITPSSTFTRVFTPKTSISPRNSTTSLFSAMTNTILSSDSKDPERKVIYSNANALTISNFTIQSGVRGIQVAPSYHTPKLTHITITKNIIESIDGYGIKIRDTQHVKIIHNTVRSCTAAGIKLLEVNYSTVTSNMVFDTEIGIWLIMHCHNNTISQNNITSNQKKGIEITFSCNNNVISENHITNNTKGIWLGRANHTAVQANTIQHHQQGVYLFGCSQNIFKNNTFLQNQQPAFFINSFHTTWKHNYWNHPRMLPKPIPGVILIDSLRFPTMKVDWQPAVKPPA